jgi:hypothetical protein
MGDYVVRCECFFLLTFLVLMENFQRDEDFDESYESLISLAQTLGEAKPRATPESVIAALETGKYKDWRTPDSDQRCPICLDDVRPFLLQS